MKIADLRGMTVSELEKLLEDKREAVFNLRFQKAKRVLTNVHSIRLTRKDIARIYTLLNEKKRGVNVN